MVSWPGVSVFCGTDSRLASYFRLDAFLQPMRESGLAGGYVLRTMRQPAADRRGRTAGVHRPAGGAKPAHGVHSLLCARTRLDRRHHRAGIAKVQARQDGPVPRVPGTLPVRRVADGGLGTAADVPGLGLFAAPSHNREGDSVSDERFYDGESGSGRELFSALVW